MWSCNKKYCQFISYRKRNRWLAFRCWWSIRTTTSSRGTQWSATQMWPLSRPWRTCLSSTTRETRLARSPSLCPYAFHRKLTTLLDRSWNVSWWHDYVCVMVTINISPAWSTLIIAMNRWEIMHIYEQWSCVERSHDIMKTRQCSNVRNSDRKMSNWYITRPQK